MYIAVSDVTWAKGFIYAQAWPPEDNMLLASGLRHPCIRHAVMDGPRPRYTYQLQEGITADRQGRAC